jgi:putative addiction module killer protein
MEATPRNVEALDEFDEYMAGLRDGRGKGQIEARINKLRRGLLGTYDDVGDGIVELKLDNVGPGYRIYITDDGEESLILTAGTKRTQATDITRAKALWREYKRGQA